MSSYEEALFYQRNCPGTQMDGDHDGIPCEQQFNRWLYDGGITLNGKMNIITIDNCKIDKKILLQAAYLKRLRMFRLRTAP